MRGEHRSSDHVGNTHLVVCVGCQAGIADGGVSVEKVHVLNHTHVRAVHSRHLNERFRAMIGISVHAPREPQFVASQSGAGYPRVGPVQPAAAIGRA